MTSQEERVTYKFGLSKCDYYDLLDGFVTRIVGQIIDDDELNYEARAVLAHILVKAIDADDDQAVIAFCAKHEIPVAAISNILPMLKELWRCELEDLTGRES